MGWSKTVKPSLTSRAPRGPTSLAAMYDGFQVGPVREDGPGSLVDGEAAPGARPGDGGCPPDSGGGSRHGPGDGGCPPDSGGGSRQGTRQQLVDGPLQVDGPLGLGQQRREPVGAPQRAGDGRHRRPAPLGPQP